MVHTARFHDHRLSLPIAQQHQPLTGLSPRRVRTEGFFG